MDRRKQLFGEIRGLAWEHKSDPRRMTAWVDERPNDPSAGSTINNIFGEDCCGNCLAGDQGFQAHGTRRCKVWGPQRFLEFPARKKLGKTGLHVAEARPNNRQKW